MSSLLVIGGSGFIGARLVMKATQRGYCAAYTYAHRSLNLPAPAYPLDWTSDNPPLEEIIRATHPDAVVYAAIPPMKSDESLHRCVSVEGVEQTLHTLSCHRPDALFIYLSTNSVFGSGDRPHREADPPDPELRHDQYRIYGLTKAAGECVAQSWPNTIIARTSNVDGRTASGDLSPRLARLVDGLAQGRETRLFTDRFLTPTLVDNLIDALLEILSGAVTYRGVLHLAGSQVVTHYDHAHWLAKACGFDSALIQPESMDDSPTMRGSPRHIGLDVAFTQTLLTTHLLDVPAQMARLFHRS